MALIQCIECGKEISSMAEHCPYCGIPLKVMIDSHMPQPEQQIVLTKQSAPQPEESVQQYPQPQPSPQSEQQFQQTQPSPQSEQQYQQTQPSPQQKPAKKPISFGKPAITIVICMVLEFIFKFAGEDIGGIVGANLIGLADLISWVRYGAFILLIVRLVEWAYRKLKK